MTQPTLSVIFSGCFSHHTFFIIERLKIKKALEIQGLFNGAGAVTRTPDPRITNALLYQLSYTGD